MASRQATLSATAVPHRLDDRDPGVGVGLTKPSNMTDRLDLENPLENAVVAVLGQRRRSVRQQRLWELDVVKDEDIRPHDDGDADRKRPSVSRLADEVGELDLLRLPRRRSVAERWLAKFGHCYKWNTLPERGTFGVDQE